MSKHLFGLIVTPYGTAANNRGESESNTTSLQKIFWKNEVHTTVSAEAIRWAIRYYWQKTKGDNAVNRRWNEEAGEHDWQDQKWKPWTSTDESDRQKQTYIDDDVLGFMLAEAASTDGSDDLQEQSKTLDKTSNSKTNKPKGKADKRKGALEVTRAVSLLPFAGDITFNAKSGTKSSTSLYATEMHATRYQYGFAITPESLREKSRVLDVIDAVVNLTKVGGNQSRFLYQFAPDSVVFRWTDDFAPRILYGFEMDSLGNLSFEAVLEKVKCGDVLPKELFIGGSIVKTLSESDRTSLEGAFLSDSVKAAATKLKDKIKEDLGV